MNPETAAKLTALNRRFYQTFSADFSATRGRLQPGVLRALADLPPEADVLDLGCGNGLLARALAERGHRGRYVGLDFSASLLATARAALEPFPAFDGRFLLFDLTQTREVSETSRVFPGGPFARVFAFAVLHHLPGAEARLALLRAVREALVGATRDGRPSGQMVISNWQFLASEKWRARIVPWERVGLAESEVDPGDYLLDWRRGGVGYRYIHHFTEAELAGLAAEAGLRAVETWRSDGEGGKSGLYTRLICKTGGSET